MSPHQASGQDVDFRADQFSYGAILYEMATGKCAFARSTGVETMVAVIREEPEPIGRLNPEIPLPLQWTIERCLAKNPGDRFASTRDLAHDLTIVRDHLREAVRAAPLRGGGAVGSFRRNQDPGDEPGTVARLRRTRVPRTAIGSPGPEQPGGCRNPIARSGASLEAYRKRSRKRLSILMRPSRAR